MKEFTFRELIEHTVWQSQTFTVEAETYEEAKEKFLFALDSGDDFQYSDGNLEYDLEDIVDTGNYELQDEEGNVIRKEQR